MQWTEIMTSYLLFQNNFIMRRSRVVIFAEIMKIVTISIKKIFQDSKKVKRIRNYASKWNYINIS